MNRRYSIIFNSVTGNTRKLAETIREALPQEDCDQFGALEGEVPTSQRLYIGFWTDKGRCNQEITDLLKTLKGKEVFLFGTAGFGGSQEYFDKILSSVQKCLGASNTVIGTYMCQGKMPMQVRQKYEMMENSGMEEAKVKAMLRNFDEALLHPDAEDLKNAAAFAVNVMDRLKNREC